MTYFYRRDDGRFVSAEGVDVTDSLQHLFDVRRARITAGALGGKVRSAIKAARARENGRHGGRPRTQLTISPE